ncbi:uncharacterized protein B0T15DRAFT_570480 [Chaetomium strumarium]|uniref:Uncharacterized protein n=1 Tax=Chaetomium strumarium TaxID=1170767 RepID=A0AAJ0H1H9_9PEZI|nr:hypothetical protein B0T15DRAFT_570480 [Chaetomium strumarium]
MTELELVKNTVKLSEANENLARHLQMFGGRWWYEDGGCTSIVWWKPLTALIERRAKLIRDIVNSPEATKYRSHKNTQRASRLKDILAVFLPNDTDSKAAKDGVVYDISVIASTAWDVSAKVLEAPITFVFRFNDVNSLFVTEMHEELDSSTDPRQFWNEKCIPRNEHRSQRDQATRRINLKKYGNLLRQGDWWIDNGVKIFYHPRGDILEQDLVVNGAAGPGSDSAPALATSRDPRNSQDGELGLGALRGPAGTSEERRVSDHHRTCANPVGAIGEGSPASTATIDRESVERTGSRHPVGRSEMTETSCRQEAPNPVVFAPLQRPWNAMSTAVSRSMDASGTGPEKVPWRA